MGTNVKINIFGTLPVTSVGFPTQVDFTCAQLRSPCAQVNLIARNSVIIARNFAQGNCAQFRAIAFYFLAFIFQFFENF